MSYCRWGWDGSDVYVFESTEAIECCACIQPGYNAASHEEMIVHLAQHRRNGDFVPAYAVEALWHDIPGAKEPVEREPSVMAARERLAETAAFVPDINPFVEEMRRHFGMCGECGRKKQAP